MGESAKTLAEALTFDSDFDRTAERLGTYAFLKTTEDQTDTQRAWRIDFDDGAVVSSNKGDDLRVRAVRGPDTRRTENLQTRTPTPTPSA